MQRPLQVRVQQQVVHVCWKAHVAWQPLAQQVQRGLQHEGLQGS